MTYQYDKSWADKFKAPPKEFKPLTEGWYRVVTIDAVQAPNKKGTGEYLHVQFKIGEGQEGEGKVLHSYFNNVSFEFTKAVKEYGWENVEIPFWISQGKREEARFMDAIGVEACKGTDDLLGKKLEVAVIQEEYDHPERGKVTTNRVKDWRPSGPHTSIPAPTVDGDDDLPEFMR